ncbi:hypothetical protein IMG5_006450 [Ichthyophthirius multifiliis]|uniref:Uncharacterized protein n=1 Tax=Ichthyophthirius multifiliis TaxID=5932 RepID=G0QJL8_ICHMU|nr:hypothetical protein IMG5_006450 [Ichthyophthirius multifiliis]EGR34584.1 hypothetical protein IMG5_006450 [Ichthyophthirius multifiliis]|eukprot:XP_004039888.1 hypothetical protein IMG5_006450 [Ichthyophthirius multifiliis]
MKKLIPAILSDIDGVLVRGKNPIPRTQYALNYIRQSLKKIYKNTQTPYIDNENIPFLCLTNGGGILEQEKADQLNDILKLKDNKLDYSNIILNYTPLRPILSQYSDKFIILGGKGKLIEIAESCGLKQFLTIEEFASIYPKYFQERQRIQQFKAFEIAKQRFQQTNSEIFLHIPPAVHGIFILNDPLFWEDNIQLILNYTVKANKLPIPLYVVNNDLTYADSFRLNRLAFGAFSIAVISIAEKIYNRNIQMQVYGKPSFQTYDYAKKKLQNMSQSQIGNIYMIGDNPKSDIKGGNENGCITILKRCFLKSDNDYENPGNYVVDDFYEAIQKICELENIPFQPLM